MNVGKRITSTFLVLGLIVILASVFAVQVIETHLKKIGGFHSEVLYSIQNIQSKLIEAVEESFAYAVSGDVQEKEEFLQWADRFDHDAREFFKLAHLDQPREEEEKKLFQEIVSVQPTLVKQAQAIFEDYEKTGSVSSTNFHRYEHSIDVITAALEHFVQIEKKEVEHSHVIALATIEESRYLIYGVGFLTLVLAVLMGLFISNSIAQPLSKLKKAADEIGEGRFAGHIEVQSQDEIGVLARTFETMSAQVQERTQALERINREREHLISELEGKNAEMEQFSYTVSHDLKSPLITIAGWVTMLEKDAADKNPARMQDDIGRIKGAVKKMKRQLDELLELSRVGRLVNPPEEISMAELASQVMDQVAGQIKERQVNVEISSDLPVVFADASRIFDVMQNLIANAVQYMGDQQEPRVEIGCRQENGETVLYVKDNGIGIEPRYHQRVFGLFERLNQKDGVGTGIGLAIVKRIVEFHGGRIWIESEGKNKGCTVCFTIPSKEGTLDHAK